MENSILYPLPFAPIFKDKIWGGDKIKTVLYKDFSPLRNCGEMWVLSGHNDDVSVVSDGPLAENDLNELIGIFFDDLMGSKRFSEDNPRFPLLVKIINSNSWLSIQVHPDDALAAKLEIDSGKDEMWYVLDAAPKAKIIAGFKKELTLQEYKKHVSNNTLEEVLNYVNVRKGDAVFIPAGMVHALGPGLLVAEIQQSSDTTYRIYDWNRVDENGNPRELHQFMAERAINFSDNKPPVLVHPNTDIENKRIRLINSDNFNTNIIRVTRRLDFTLDTEDTFIALLAFDGEGTVSSNGVTTVIRRGEAVLIPASLDGYSIENTEGDLMLIEIYL